ncbi:hypothetical protein KPL74_11000 [Bacillus sp. NP157]|nr:hypothetical protein KPL74_11000 [Bacillus sp. NP157]
MRPKTISRSASVKAWHAAHTGLTHRRLRLVVPSAAAQHAQDIADLLGVSRSALLLHLLHTAGPATAALRTAIKETAAHYGVGILVRDNEGKTIRARSGGGR